MENSNETNTLCSSPAIDETYDQEPLHLMAQFGDKFYKVMIDTGSSISLIHVETLEEFKYDGYKYNTLNQSVKTTSATNHCMSATGMVKLSFYLCSNQYFTHQFLVCSNITQKLVLGADFLTKYKFSVNFRNKSMYTDKSLPVPLYFHY